MPQLGEETRTYYINGRYFHPVFLALCIIAVTGVPMSVGAGYWFLAFFVVGIISVVNLFRYNRIRSDTSIKFLMEELERSGITLESASS